MIDTSQTVKPWVTFAGCVLVVVVLYWAQAVLVPVALAILLTFVLTPPVSWLERWIGRVAAVLTVVTLLFAVVALAGWGLARQMNHLAEDLPRYRANILAKIADVRLAGKGGSVEKLRQTIDDITNYGGITSTRREKVLDIGPIEATSRAPRNDPASAASRWVMSRGWDRVDHRRRAPLSRKLSDPGANSRHKPSARLTLSLQKLVSS